VNALRQLPRVFAGAALLLFCSSSQLIAQQTEKVAQIGILVNGAPDARFDGVRTGLLRDLAQRGYVEGLNIRLEPRFAHDKLDKLGELAQELVERKVDLILALGGVPAAAAMKATSTIPVVYVIVTDPVAIGLAKSYERPGTNATGVTSLDPAQPRKQVALLREVLPSLERLAVLSDSTLPGADARGWAPLDREIDAAARAAGVEAQILNVKGPDPDLDGAFSAMVKERAQAVLVLEAPVALSHRKQIVELATANQLITLYPPRPADPSSALIFGVNFGDVYEHVPGYIEKVLKGANPGELPVTRLTRSQFIVNVKTARSVGVTIPPEVLQRADKVVE
jgi:putative ABC transport system substrate-binding protein